MDCISDGEKLPIWKHDAQQATFAARLAVRLVLGNGIDMLDALHMVHESGVYIERKTRLREDVDIYIYDCYNRLCREYGLKPDEPRETYPYDHYASLYLFSNTFDAWFSLLDGEFPVQDLEEMFQESGIYAHLYLKLTKYKKMNPYDVAKAVSRKFSGKIPAGFVIPEDAESMPDEFFH